MGKNPLVRLVGCVVVLGFCCYAGSFHGSYYWNQSQSVPAENNSALNAAAEPAVVQYSSRCYWPSDEDMKKLDEKLDAADTIPTLTIPSPEDLGISIPDANGNKK